MTIVVFDLEATCWRSDPPAEHETIEFGAVAFEPGRGVLGDHQGFVRPRLQPVLSRFCTELTKIGQEQVETAPAFPEALGAFERFASRHAPFVLASWGDFMRGSDSAFPIGSLPRGAS